MKTIIALIFSASLMFTACGGDEKSGDEKSSEAKSGEANGGETSLLKQMAEKNCECVKLRKAGDKDAAKACKKERNAIENKLEAKMKGMSKSDSKDFEKEGRAKVKELMAACM